jgi:hypothetical protein
MPDARHRAFKKISGIITPIIKVINLAVMMDILEFLPTIVMIYIKKTIIRVGSPKSIFFQAIIQNYGIG